MNILTTGIALILGLVALVLSVLPVTKFKKPLDFFMMTPKVMTANMMIWVAFLGLVACGLGFLSSSPALGGLSFLLGGVAAFLSIRLILRVSTPHTEFEKAFGPNWRDRINPELHRRLPRRRWSIYMPSPPQPHWEQDVAFCTIPGTERKLLCDLWFPLENVLSSKLAVIYLHGGAWSAFDKDFQTRPFFRHLCAQGHFVMDVAYRLAPETNVEGMVGDVKRAVAWLKAHAAGYGIDPERIILTGGSAGAHLALLAAYAPQHPRLTPEDVHSVDLSVRAVVSYYGPPDLRALYTNVDWGRTMNNPIYHRYLRRPTPSDGSPDRYNLKKSGEALKHLFPVPDEAPGWFALTSPVEHVQPDCPATLLLHGGGDSFAPPAATHGLAEKLRAAGVPVLCIMFPDIEHGFDMILPQWSPAVQASYYDVDHFLALMT